MALTEKQKAFVREYLVDLNATQAAIRAGYSKKNADRIGPELLGKTCVSAAVSEALQKRAERTEITQDKVLEEIARYAFKEASDALDSDFKHTSKTKYIDMLCKHLGTYDARRNDQDDGGVTIVDDL